MLGEEEERGNRVYGHKGKFARLRRGTAPREEDRWGRRGHGLKNV